MLLQSVSPTEPRCSYLPATTSLNTHQPTNLPDTTAAPAALSALTHHRNPNRAPPKSKSIRFASHFYLSTTAASDPGAAASAGDDSTSRRIRRSAGLEVCHRNLMSGDGNMLASLLGLEREVVQKGAGVKSCPATDWSLRESFQIFEERLAGKKEKNFRTWKAWQAYLHFTTKSDPCLEIYLKRG
ncbi:hypothetical protein F0562_022173 [Nyssa sinensis]|uniref:Uncharacterized protein n=1 Tax=Nyssa sinensis TaxID=561372 RepID=A0A5J5BSK7_9ASTE|nr:hypothetical protein F0562_022173 [Nyssa sinensis]